jgi:IS30 family transposase
MSFRHLSQSEVHDILRSFDAGETKSQIATRYGIDHSTVIYHIRKHERRGSLSSDVYAVVAVREPKPCIHPSSKCLVCGLPQDELRRLEREQIRELTSKLQMAQERLRMNGIPVE